MTTTQTRIGRTIPSNEIDVIIQPSDQPVKIQIRRDRSNAARIRVVVIGADATIAPADQNTD